MLHYRIMDYEDKFDWGGRVYNLVDMTEPEYTEKKFIKELNMHSLVDAEEPFTDELSAKLLREVDHSRRVAAYTVETRIGRGCITCLATGVKFGLMVIHMAKFDRPVITRPKSVGINVIKWLANNGDFTLVILENNCDSSLTEVLYLIEEGLADLEYNGRVYSKQDAEDCWKALDELLDRESKY